MPLINCKECGREVSTTASVCPNCGAPVRAGMRTSTVLILILTGVALIGCLAVGGFAYLLMRARATAQNTLAQTVTEEAQEDSSAPSMVRAYEENELAADQKYKGKIVRVIGEVSDISTGAFGDTPFVRLKGSGLFRGVRCQLLSGGAIESAAKIRVGDEITIKGRGAGLMADVQIQDCWIERIPSGRAGP